MQQLILTHTPWYRRAIEHALDRLMTPAPRASSLRELDASALADIGVHASEFDSIEAEAGRFGVEVTRRRIVVASA